MDDKQNRQQDVKVREGKSTTGQRTTAIDPPHSVNASSEGPMRFQDMWFLEKLALFDRETSTSHQSTHKKLAAASSANAPDS